MTPMCLQTHPLGHLGDGLDVMLSFCMCELDCRYVVSFGDGLHVCELYCR